MAPLEPLVDKRPTLRDSTHIGGYGYAADRRVLAVWFKDGTLFHHHNVPLEVFERWLDSESVGSFYHGTIRGKFHSVKMTGHCPNCGAQGLVGVPCPDCGTAEVAPDPKPVPREPAGLRRSRDRDIDRTGHP